MFGDRIWFGPFLLLGGFKPFALVNAIPFLILFLQSIIDDRLVLLLLNTLNIPKHMFCFDKRTKRSSQIGKKEM